MCLDGQGAEEADGCIAVVLPSQHLLWGASLRSHRRRSSLGAGRVLGIQGLASGLVCRPSADA